MGEVSVEAGGRFGGVLECFTGGSAESNTTHGADGAVLSPPVRKVVVVFLLQDVVLSSVVGFLVHHPAGATYGSEKTINRREQTIMRTTTADDTTE